MELRHARQIADLLIRNEFGPACVQIVAAGSIRREKPEVRDIEIVAEPRYRQAPDLFGAATGQRYSELDDALADAMRAGRIEYDTVTKRNGNRYKRLWLPAHGIAVDLFLADPGNWGNILAIRTGNANFSRALVTSRTQGGLLPSDLRQDDGYLWRGGVRLVCRTEGEFFERLGLPVVPPEARTGDLARELAGRRSGRAA